MSLSEPLTVISGNLTGDPEMRYTATGIACVNFSVAHNTRTRNSLTGEWEDGTTVFMRCVAWRDLAENMVQSVRRGDPVLVVGRIRQRIWQDKSGKDQRATEIHADTVAVPMDRRVLRLTKVTRESATPDTAPAESEEAATN